jgi:PadR family transcriptional regulator, regulatory protein PadR
MTSPTGRETCVCHIERTPNFMQPRLLLQLAKQPTHGYDLMGILGADADFSPDPGNLYRVLRSIEEEGLVQSNWDTEGVGPARRVYEITDLGLEYLHAWAIIIRKTQKQLEYFLTDYESHFINPVQAK